MYAKHYSRFIRQLVNAEAKVDSFGTRHSVRARDTVRYMRRCIGRFPLHMRRWSVGAIATLTYVRTNSIVDVIIINCTQQYLITNI